MARIKCPLVGFETIASLLPSSLLLQHDMLCLEILDAHDVALNATDSPSSQDPSLQWIERRIPSNTSSSSPCLVADFLPAKPLDPIVQLSLLLGASRPGQARIRRLSRSPYLTLPYQVLGTLHVPPNESLDSLSSRLLLFNATYPNQLALFRNDCRTYVDALTTFLLDQYSNNNDDVVKV